MLYATIINSGFTKFEVRILLGDVYTCKISCTISMQLPDKGPILYPALITMVCLHI
jgi:hypothetical protein